MRAQVQLLSNLARSVAAQEKHAAAPKAVRAQLLRKGRAQLPPSRAPRPCAQAVRTRAGGAQETDSNGRPDEEVAAEAWAKYRLRNNSVIVDNFQVGNF